MEFRRVLFRSHKQSIVFHFNKKSRHAHCDDGFYMIRKLLLLRGFAIRRNTHGRTLLFRFERSYFAMLFTFFFGRMKLATFDIADPTRSSLISSAARLEAKSTKVFFSQPALRSKVLLSTKGNPSRKPFDNQSDFSPLSDDFAKENNPLTKSTPGILEVIVPSTRDGTSTFFRNNVYWSERYASCSAFNSFNRAISAFKS